MKSALLFCGVFSNSDISITGDRGSRDHTERMLRALGAGIDYDAAQCHVTPRPLRGGELRIPGDFSGAAFFIAGACIAAGSNILLRDIGINPTRTGFLDILARMGAHITVSNRREWNGEPVADLRVESASLHGTDVAADLARRAIDEIVVLGAVAAFARGVTTISGIGDLRHKESDRLAAISRLLGCAGARVHSAGNGIAIHPGSTGRQKWNLASHGDHRTVMAAAALAAGAGDVTTDGAAAPAVSFPHFATEWTRAQR